MNFEVVVWTMKDEKCSTMNQLAEKLSERYIKEDLNRIEEDLEYCYSCSIK